ncbi:helix-turn-helix domain-containing protein [Anaerocolumna xylanovorans]|uniref:DNA binding domain-containing protein, excisionase family n=1 Tax=Anaerocolumna xylanovorans DSM 12503 TaxID=1121345 RepID=A0A1M7Y8S1_9FIRM|nr:helix-turn-helix domain-containing protein [Anaerocolumna xylanovorans]SHO48918.1 DNA binding domain-containing protein, excisionase family [Anaerocolumna xylanovorans DSM 12503]
MEKITYSIDEAAKIVGVGRSLMYQLAREGKIPVLRLGNRFVIPKKRFEIFINSSTNL